MLSRAPQGVEPRSGKTRSTNTSALVCLVVIYTFYNLNIGKKTHFKYLKENSSNMNQENILFVHAHKAQQSAKSEKCSRKRLGHRPIVNALMND